MAFVGSVLSLRVSGHIFEGSKGYTVGFGKKYMLPSYTTAGTLNWFLVRLS